MASNVLSASRAGAGSAVLTATVAITTQITGIGVVRQTTTTTGGGGGMTVFTPPHTVPVFRVLKQAYREYHSGPGAVLVVTTPAIHAANAVTPVSGTLEVDASCVLMPAAVTVDLIQGGVVKATQSAPTAGGNPATYTTTFPVSVCVAGTATARVSSVVPLKTFTTPAFTLT